MQSTAILILLPDIGFEIRQIRGLLVVLGLEDLATTIRAVRADVVAHVQFAGSGFDRRGRRDEKIVRTMHAALGRALFVLLNSHGDSCNRVVYCKRKPAS